MAAPPNVAPHPSTPDDGGGPTRRRFLAFASAALTSAIAAALGVPLVSALVGPALRRAKARLVRVGPASAVQAGPPVALHYADVEVEAYLREAVVRTVWAVRGADDRVTVFSPICTHLGCRFDWDGAQDHFHCPCHGSVFGPDGRVISGPAPRPLDTLPSEVRDGDLFVAWERFEPGIPEKKEI